MNIQLSDALKLLSKEKWDKARLIQLVDQIHGRRVLVVGDVGLDRYTIGSVDRISPEAPVPILWVREETFRLGLAANVADNVGSLGGKALLLGVVGKDRTAEDFEKLLKSQNLETGHLVVDPSRRTVLKERLVGERQQLLRVDYESVGRISDEVEKKVIARFAELVPSADVVILEDYAKGMIHSRLASEILAIASKNKKTVLVDPNRRTPIETYLGAHVIKPNRKEAETLSGVLITDHDSLMEAGKRILERAQAKNVMITLGQDGMAIFSSAEKKAVLIPTNASEVYDISGAGDTVIAVLAMSLAAGATLEEAAIMGNIAAGIVVAKFGTATTNSDEMKTAIARF